MSFFFFLFSSASVLYSSSPCQKEEHVTEYRVKVTTVIVNLVTVETDVN